MFKRYFKKCFSIKFNTNNKNFNQEYIELRSDVKTLPTKEMLESVQSSIFGDDAAGEDPTTNELCQKLSELFGKERAILLPTGLMANMVGLLLYSGTGRYVIQGARAHINLNEGPAQKFLGIEKLITPEVDIPKDNFNLSNVLKEANFTKNSKEIDIICFENSHNFCGGKIINTKNVEKIKSDLASSPEFKHIKFHLDGSRLLNTAAALHVNPKTLTKPYDTINFCLSKGFGGPCGSILLMDEKNYEKAMFIRKNTGGAMRQSGIFCAPALVAFQTWQERFLTDHSNAKLLANGLNNIKGLECDVPDTNIVNIYLKKEYFKNIPEALNNINKVLGNDYKILLLVFFNEYIRAVTHYQVSTEQIKKTIEAFEIVVKKHIG